MNKNKNRGFIATAVLYSLVALILIVMFIILRNFQTIRNIERDDGAKIKGQVLYYDVYFNGNEATGGRMEKQRISSGKSEQLSANQYTNSGYKFIGWKKTPDGDCNIDGSNKNCYQDKESVYNLTTSGKRITLYAHWVPETATVTFDANGGTTPNPTSKTVTYKQKYGDLATSSREGFTLSWWTEKTAGTQVTKDTRVRIKGNHTLYAHWNVKYYSISYDSDGGTSVSSASFRHNFDGTTRLGSVIKETFPTTAKQGKIFQGWYSAKGTAGTKIDINMQLQNQNYTFYAHWSDDPGWPNYKLTLDPNGGSVSPTIITVPSNIDPRTKIKVAPDPTFGSLNIPDATREFYKFDGWFTEKEAGKGKKISSNDIFELKDQTIYAHWTEKSEYKVIYDRGVGDRTTKTGSIIPDMKPSYFTVGKSSRLSSNSYKKYGYLFSGWSKNNDTSKACDASQKNQSKADFCFADGAYVTDLAEKQKSITLFAKWTAKQIAVTYDGNGGTIGEKKAAKVTKKAKAFGTKYPSVTKPVYEGRTFLGWYFDNYTPESQLKSSVNIGLERDHTKQVTSDNTFISNEENDTVYARWRKNQWTVTFNGNGGTYKGASSKTVTYDEPYGDLPVPTRANYTFTGWNTEEKGKGTTVDKRTTVRKNKNHTLYAQWTINKYKVTFDPNAAGATRPVPYTRDIEYNTNYGDLPTNAKNGDKVFLGWFTERTGGDIVTKKTKMTRGENHSLYAHWLDEKAEGIKIIYSPKSKVNLIPKSSWSVTGLGNAKHVGEIVNNTDSMYFKAERKDGNGAGLKATSAYFTTDGYQYINIKAGGREYSSDIYINGKNGIGVTNQNSCNPGDTNYYNKNISGKDKIRLHIEVYSGYAEGDCNDGKGGVTLYKVILANRVLSKAEMNLY